MPQNAHVLDYGCGSGRFLLPLAPHVKRIAGFDISLEALGLLQDNLQDFRQRDRIYILGPEQIQIDAHVKKYHPFDLIICLFGVLAHVNVAAERQRILRHMAASLKDGVGRLVLSVPNKNRRFLKEQRASASSLADGNIKYLRHYQGKDIHLPYQLFSADKLRHELEAAGFKDIRIVAESVFTESQVTNHNWLGRIDQILRPLCPAALGYGLIAEARAA